MPRYPYRDLGTSLGRDFRNNLNANFDDIEADLRDIQSNLDAKESRLTQIENDSIERDNDLDARIDNIVANAGSSNTEIVDARYDSINNVTYPTLKDRLDDTSDKIGILFKNKSEWINVKQPPYNATGNGVTDDSAAIQAAINAQAVTGGVVYIPTGTYKAEITLKSGVILVGDGFHNTKCTILKAKTPGGTVISTGTLTTDCSYSGIYNLMIDGDTGSGNAGIGLSLVYFTNMSFVRDVRIVNCDKSVYMEKSWYANLTNVQGKTGIYGLYIYGSSGTQQVNAINFTNCYFNGFTENAAYLAGSGKGNTFKGCTFEGSQKEGMLIKDTMSGTVVDSCYFENNGQSMANPTNIALDSSATDVSLTVIGGQQTISNNGIGIDARAGEALLVSGVSFANTTGATALHFVKSNATYTAILPCSCTGDAQSYKNFNVDNSPNSFVMGQTSPKMFQTLTAKILDLMNTTSYNASSDSHILLGSSNDTAVDSGKIHKFEFLTNGGASGQQLILRAYRRGGATEDVFTVKDFNIDFGGKPLQNVFIYGLTSLPTPGAGQRGRIVFIQGGTGVADGVYVCRKKADDTYEWARLDM
jgi:hypothetical protein